MNLVRRAPDWTDEERQFMRVPPYKVEGVCGTCKRDIVTVRVYGLKAELPSSVRSAERPVGD